jgi:hypothetical protein
MTISPCIPWTGRIDKDGYGTTTGDGRMAHRVALERHLGTRLPGDVDVDHLCHDPLVCNLGSKCPHRRCVNVEHLEAVPHLMNVRRGGRYHKPTCINGHPYTPENTIVRKGDHWNCRICQNASSRRYQSRIRAKKAA